MIDYVYIGFGVENFELYFWCYCYYVIKLGLREKVLKYPRDKKLSNVGILYIDAIAQQLHEHDNVEFLIARVLGHCVFEQAV